MTRLIGGLGFFCLGNYEPHYNSQVSKGYIIEPFVRKLNNGNELPIAIFKGGPKWASIQKFGTVT